MLSTYQSHEIEENWHKIEPFIKRVLKKIDLYYTAKDIKNALIKARMQLWTSYTGTQLTSVCITQIVIHPKHKYLEIIAMAGSKDSFKELSQIEHWAKSMGCKKIQLEGRKGWKVVLKGYKEKSIQLEKEL